MKILILIFLALPACALPEPQTYVCPSTTITVQTDEAINLRQENAQWAVMFGQCVHAYNELNLKCPEL